MATLKWPGLHESCEGTYLVRTVSWLMEPTGKTADSASGNPALDRLQRTGLQKLESIDFDELLKLANCQFHHGDHTGVLSLQWAGNLLTWLSNTRSFLFDESQCCDPGKQLR